MARRASSESMNGGVAKSLRGAPIVDAFHFNFPPAQRVSLR
jgi:hypothetical protein